VTNHHRVAILTLSLALAGTAACAHSAPAHTKPPTRGVTILQTVDLPGNSDPNSLALGLDGAIYATETADSAIARVDATGGVQQFRIPGSGNDPEAIIRGPNNLIWFTGLEMIGYLGTDGQIYTWRDGNGQAYWVPGLPHGLALGTDGNIWYTDESEPTSITRLTPPNTFTRYKVPNADSAELLPGIIAGPDGGIWFTMSESNKIGRLDPDGTVREWPLGRDTNPRIMVAGSDAVWFTEANGIGRATAASGPIDYPVGATVGDAATAPDLAIWFLTASTLGTIDDNGHVQQWPVPGESHLGALLVLPDGTFWLTDNDDARLLHVSLHQS
jgi:virginiamycin B lyase